MKTYSQYLAIGRVAAFALACSAATGMPAIGQTIKVPAVPNEIQVPAGNKAYLKGHAMGTQNYICMPSATGFAWTFTGPQATLFVTIKWIGGDIQQQITTHFLSPNPAEGGTARATWQSSLDTSSAWARAIASSTDSGFVEAGAVPWLLLQVVGTRRGPIGGFMLSETSFVQRVNTSGGVMPSAGCSEAMNVGSTAFVPYTADYIFYKSGDGK